jgi:hypothetical protein
MPMDKILKAKSGTHGQSSLRLVLFVWLRNRNAARLRLARKFAILATAKAIQSGMTEPSTASCLPSWCCLLGPRARRRNHLFVHLRRDGGLIGKQRVTYAKLSEDSANSSRDAAARDTGARASRIENISAAFDHCMPTPIGDSLSGAIVGQPLTIRIKFRCHINDI